MDNYMLHYMLMERQRSAQAQDPTAFRNSPRLRRSKRSSKSSAPIPSSASSDPATMLDSPAPRDRAVVLTPAREAIERRAYEIYLERGGGDGHELDDWIQAERELRAGLHEARIGA